MAAKDGPDRSCSGGRRREYGRPEGSKKKAGKSLLSLFYDVMPIGFRTKASISAYTSSRFVSLRISWRAPG